MRKILLPLLLSTASTMALADDHLYGGFEAGITSLGDSELNRTLTGLSLEDEKKMGGMGGLYFGKAMGKWRLEGEMAVRRNHYESIDVAGGGTNSLPLNERGASGKLTSTALMGNLWYRLAGTDEWGFYTGAGFGLANVDVNNFRTGSKVIIDDSSWSTAGQVMAQVIKSLPGGLELGIGARHFRTFDNSLNTPDGTAGYKVRNNELFARLSWKFGADEPRREPEPMPAAPAPRPAAQPEPVATPEVVEQPAPKPEPKPMPLPGPFMVFFDFDKADITPEAARIIREAAKAFKEHKAVRLLATGHTDRAGTEEYNARLAKRRADAVKAALMAEGVAAGSIITDAKGENSPLVSTEDGVREPQNRRAEIVLRR